MPAVTVTNNLPRAAGASLGVVLSRVDEPAGSPTLKFPYSPHEISITPSPGWTARKAAGAETSKMDWTGNGPERVSLNTRQQARPGDTGRLENMISKLKTWATRPTDLTQMPSRVSMTWGDYFYVGVITGLVIKKEVVDDRGNALVAGISFTLTESL